MKKNKKYSIYSITLILILSCAIYSINADNTEVTAINIDSINLISTNTSSTLITITNVTDLAIAFFEINWDPSIINLISINDSINQFDMFIKNVDNENGTLKINTYEFGSGLSGNLNVCSLEFQAANTAVDGDICEISILNSNLIEDTLLETIDHEVNDANATISKPSSMEDPIIVYVEDIDIPYLGSNSGYLQVLDAMDLAFISLNLTWDPSILNLNTINIDNIHSDFDSVFYTIDNDEGKLSIDAYNFESTGLNGNVNVAYITFESTRNCMIGDSTPLIINNSVLWNINPDQINHSIDDGTALIVNNTTDVIVNIEDIVIPVGGYNTTLIKIKNCYNLAIASFIVTWDPSIIALINVNTSNNVTDFDLIFNSIDEENGSIKFDAYKFGSSGLNGDINVAALTFEAINQVDQEQCNLTLSNSMLWGAIPYTINHSVNNGIATIIQNVNEVPMINIDSINIISSNTSNSLVTIENVVDLAIASLNISWDPNVANLILVNDTLNPFSTFLSDINVLDGYVVIDAYKFGNGLTGDFDICSLEFEAAANASDGDTCQLTIHQSTIWNSSTVIMDNYVNNGIATIYESVEPLIGSAGGPYNGKEFDNIQLHGYASGGISPYEFRWDLDNDGVYDDSDAQNITNTWTTAGTYNIALKIIDSNNASIIVTTTVTITSDTSGDDDDDDDGGGGNTNSNTKYGEQTEINNNPIAIIYLSSNVETVDAEIIFDASRSSDPDGDNLTFLWDFGDGSISTNKLISYSYKNQGSFNITLTVDDLNGGKNSTSETITILPPGNNPPEKPSISGPDNGSKNIEYSFSIWSIDLDNDNISYVINWDDGTSTTTVFDLSNVTVNQTNQWEKAGVYSIIVTANDGKTDSQSAKHIMLIDAINVKDIGYLVDIDNDSIYDEFVNKDGTVKTGITEDNGIYSLDVDNDEVIDYQYTLESDKLTEYQSSDDPVDEENYDGIIILGIVILLLLIIIAVVSSMRGKKQEDISKPAKKPKDVMKEKPTEKPKDVEKEKPAKKPKVVNKSKPSGKSKATKNSKSTGGKK